MCINFIYQHYRAHINLLDSTNISILIKKVVKALVIFQGFALKIMPSLNKDIQGNRSF